MAELIEKEALLEEVEVIGWYNIGENGHLVHGGRSDMDTYLPAKEVFKAIANAPAVELGGDFISRKETLRALMNLDVNEDAMAVLHTLYDVAVVISDMPAVNAYCPNCGKKLY